LSAASAGWKNQSAVCLEVSDGDERCRLRGWAAFSQRCGAGAHGGFFFWARKEKNGKPAGIAWNYFIFSKNSKRWANKKKLAHLILLVSHQQGAKGNIF
jgi:hypothetical protein